MLKKVIEFLKSFAMDVINYFYLFMIGNTLALFLGISFGFGYWVRLSSGKFVQDSFNYPGNCIRVLFYL